MQAKYIPREVYDAGKEELDKQISILNTEKDKAQGRSTVYGIIIPAIIGIFTLLLSLYLNGKL